MNIKELNKEILEFKKTIDEQNKLLKEQSIKIGDSQFLENKKLAEKILSLNTEENDFKIGERVLVNYYEQKFLGTISKIEDLLNTNKENYSCNYEQVISIFNKNPENFSKYIYTIKPFDCEQCDECTHQTKFYFFVFQKLTLEQIEKIEEIENSIKYLNKKIEIAKKSYNQIIDSL